MSEVATAYVSIIPSAKGFREKLSSSIGDAGGKEGDSQGRRFGQRFSIGARGSLGALRYGAFGAAAGIAAIGGMAIKTGLQTAAGLEQANISFSTLLGNTGKAKQFVGQLSKFAAATPFTLPGVIDASRQLLGVGASAQSVIPTLTAWGDTVGGLGLSQDNFNHAMLALTQAMANGKLQAGDMLQITQAGIPIWKIMSKALDMPVAKVRELSSQGKLLTADVLPKLQAQMEKDYGGAMARQSQTLSGLWGTLTDTFERGLAQAIMPLEPMLRKVMPAATTLTQKAFDALSSSVGKASRFFRPAGDAVRLFIGAFTGKGANVQSYARWINIFIEAGASARTVFDRVTVTLSSLWTALRNLAVTAMPLVAAGWSAFRQIVQVVGNLLTGIVVPAIVALTSFMRQHQTVVGALVVGIGAFAGVLKLASTAVKTVTLVTKLWTAAQRVANLVLEANPIVRVAALLIGLGVALIYAYNHSATFRRIVQAALHGVLTAASAVAHFFTGTFVGAFKAVGRWLSNNWRSIVVGAALVLTGPFGGAIAYVATHWSQTWHGMERVTGMVVATLVTGLKFLADTFLTVASTVVNGAAHMFGWVPGVGGKLKRAAAAFDTFKAGVDGKLSAIARSAEQWGTQVSAGLASGIDASGHLAIAAAQRLASTVHITVKQALNIQSPSKVMRALGRWVTKGFTAGMLDNLADVTKAARQLGAMVIGAFGRSAGLTREVERQSARLEGLAKRRDGVAAGLGRAEAGLATARQNRADLRSTVTGNAQEYASLSTAAPLADDGTTNPARILSSLRQRLAGLRRFGSVMHRLTTLGLNADLLRQIWAMGPEQGLAYASAILSDPGIVRGLNSTERQIGALSNAQGRRASGSLYDAAVASARGLVNGLKAKQRELTKQMRELADAMVNELKKRLKIHSPSQVFHALGGHIAAGLALGVLAGTPAAHAAITRLATVPVAAVSAYEAPLADAFAAGGHHDHWHLDKWADQNVMRQVEQARVIGGLRDKRRSRVGRRG